MAYGLRVTDVIFCPGAPDLSQPKDLTFPSHLLFRLTTVMHCLLALVRSLIN